MREKFPWEKEDEVEVEIKSWPHTVGHKSGSELPGCHSREERNLTVASNTEQQVSLGCVDGSRAKENEEPFTLL